MRRVRVLVQQALLPAAVSASSLGGAAYGHHVHQAPVRGSLRRTMLPGPTAAACSVRFACYTGCPDTFESGVISCEKLAEVLKAPEGKKVRVVDSTWYLPNSPFAAAPGSPGPEAEFKGGPRLPNAVFFDVDGVSEPSPEGLPHMMPSEATFSKAMRELGVDHDTAVVFYDRHGIFSAPRAWYTLKIVFGHPAPVAVLDGGLPRWQALGYEVEHGLPSAPQPTFEGIQWQKDSTRVWDLQQVKANIDKSEAILVDVRPAGRFQGTAPEPRPGMRGGRVPGSVNVPFVELLTDPPRMMKSRPELETILRGKGILDGQKGADAAWPRVTASCGSGMTACIICLALHQCGLPESQMQIYDGSWAEWGGRKDTPIVRASSDGREEPTP